MKDQFDYRPEVMKALKSIIKLDISREIKNSSIDITHLFEVKDMVKGNVFYRVEMSNEGFSFPNLYSFISHLLNIAEGRLKQWQADNEYYMGCTEDTEPNSTKTFEMLELASICIPQLTKLIEKLQKAKQ